MDTSKINPPSKDIKRDLEEEELALLEEMRNLLKEDLQKDLAEIKRAEKLFLAGIAVIMTLSLSAAGVSVLILLGQ